MAFTDLWPRLEPLLRKTERPSRYIDHEFGALHATRERIEGCTTFAMVYPDTYELGQPNQAVRILVNAVNAQDDLWAERCFLPAPDFLDLMAEKDIPLFSLESCAPLGEFDVVGITLPHELAATNVLVALDAAGIPLRSADRGQKDPFVIGGGPCAYNAEPYSAFFDCITLGEGEEATVEVLHAIREGRARGASRHDILLSLAGIDGQYVPGLYRGISAEEAGAARSTVAPLEDGVPSVVEKRVWESFAQSPAWEPCVVPFCDIIHDRLNVEVLRGCSRGCRFCQAGMMYRPVRERSADNIVDSVLTGLAQTGYEEVSLTSLSSTDHSQIREILTRLDHELSGTGVRISLPSQRLDAFGVDMAELVAGAKRGGLTFAPEAGTQRLRDVINKNVTEDDLFGAIDAAFSAGWRRCKLYFMIGLPTETDEDIKGIASLAQRAYDAAKKAVPPDQRGQVRMGVSCALFVPKSQTPFQWDGQIAPEEALRRISLLRNSVKYKAVDVHWHDPSSSFVEAVMSRGGRECCDLVESAFRHGARFDAWTEYFDEDAWRTAAEQCGIDVDAVAQKSWDLDDVLPWQHLSCGVSFSFLRAERRRAQKGQSTPDCTFGTCTACGVCPGLNTDLALQEARHG